MLVDWWWTWWWWWDLSFLGIYVAMMPENILAIGASFWNWSLWLFFGVVCPWPIAGWRWLLKMSNQPQQGWSRVLDRVGEPDQGGPGPAAMSWPPPSLQNADEFCLAAIYPRGSILWGGHINTRTNYNIYNLKTHFRICLDVVKCSIRSWIWQMGF